MLRKACTWCQQKQSLPLWCGQHPKLVWSQPCCLHTIVLWLGKSCRAQHGALSYMWNEHQVAISEPLGFCKSELFGYCRLEPFGYCRLEPFGYCKSKPFGYCRLEPFGYCKSEPFGYCRLEPLGYCKSLLASVGKPFFVLWIKIFWQGTKNKVFFPHGKQNAASWMIFLVSGLSHTHMKKTLHFTPS